MTAKVVDASALAALLFGEPEGEIVADRLEGADLFAPALLDFEIASVCFKKFRRNPQQRDVLFAGLEIYPRMAIEIIAIDHRDALLLAEVHGLSSYDAAYLWLARKLSAELVTLDKRLQVIGPTRH
jgi:predicted nucleic acid-binding protein